MLSSALSDFCFRPRLTQPYKVIIKSYILVLQRSSLLLKVSVVSADITIFGKLFHTLGAKVTFLKS